MKRIWAPWRIEYIRGEHEKGCVFCNVLNDPDERSRLVIHRGKLSLVMLNKYPYIGGHLLIAPKRHVGELDELKNTEKLELMNLATKSVSVLREAMCPHGFNIGINLGQVAGAGIPEHIHIHIVPRWSGDTNFVPILGEARIINEHLESTWENLREKWGKNK